MASDDPEVRELQADMRNILSSLKELKVDMKDGFKGVHKRQDVTNGKVIKNVDKIDSLEREFLQHETSVERENVTNLRRSLSKHSDKLWGVAMVVLTLFFSYVWNKIW